MRSMVCGRAGVHVEHQLAVSAAVSASRIVSMSRARDQM